MPQDFFFKNMCDRGVLLPAYSCTCCTYDFVHALISTTNSIIVTLTTISTEIRYVLQERIVLIDKPANRRTGML